MHHKGSLWSDEVTPEYLAQVTTVGGGLTLSEGTSAPLLTTVGGGLTLSEGASAPLLTTVGGGLILYEGASAPLLTTVGGGLTLSEGTSAPLLTTVGGGLTLSEGASAPAGLVSVGGVRVTDAPEVPNLHKRVAERVKAEGLEMGGWETETACGTTYCRGGHAVMAAGEAGIALRDRTGWQTAATLIYLRNTGTVPDFFAHNAAAKEDIIRCAESN